MKKVKGELTGLNEALNGFLVQFTRMALAQGFSYHEIRDILDEAQANGNINVIPVLISNMEK